MKVSFELSTYIKRVFVLAQNICGAINDIFRSWISDGLMPKEYHLSTYKKIRLKKKLKDEFFIWSWVISEYLLQRDLPIKEDRNESEILEIVFKDYTTISHQDSPEYLKTYNWWKISLMREGAISVAEYANKKNNEHDVIEQLIDIFALRILEIINPKISKISDEQLNNEWGQSLLSVKEELLVIVATYHQVISHCFEKMNSDDIEEEFQYQLSISKKMYQIIHNWHQKK